MKNFRITERYFTYLSLYVLPLIYRNASYKQSNWNSSVCWRFCFCQTVGWPQWVIKHPFGSDNPPRETFLQSLRFDISWIWKVNATCGFSLQASKRRLVEANVPASRLHARSMLPGSLLRVTLKWLSDPPPQNWQLHVTAAIFVHMTKSGIIKQLYIKVFYFLYYPICKWYRCAVLEATRQ